MDKNNTHSKRSRMIQQLLSLVMGLLLIFLLWQTGHWSRQLALENLQQQSQHQLRLFVANLQGELQKYEFLPELLATNSLLINFLHNPNDVKSINALNRYLETINEVANASDTYLMNAEGWTIAASNWLSERPFIGRNFAYRPYFQEAMQGKLGRYFALGSTSNKRGYYFAYPVKDDSGILGAVVIKIELQGFEQSWRELKEEFAVTDPDGVIFISTKDEWRYKSLYPLDQAVINRVQDSKRYGKAEIGTLNVSQKDQLTEQAKVVNIGDPRQSDHLMLVREMPEAGWKVHIFSSLGVVNSQVLKSLLITTIVYVAIVFLFFYFIQRSRRLKERERYEKRAKRVLEQRVKERTADLTSANIRLLREIEEHRRTDETLRKTQDELIQAAKMAALGQLSSGINHELNQPLAAIRSYADNARAYLVRDRKDDASWNLEQIAELTERMATISRQLKVFSRKTTGQLVTVSLQAVIDNAMKIVGPQLKDTETDFRRIVPADDIYVQADMIQLEQVLVNLITNAVHAVEQQSERWIQLMVSTDNGKASIQILDNGPGIAFENLDQIFDPFFTTKSEDRGLGLGLSISYRIVEMMHGTLTADNHDSGGAVFTLLLDLAVLDENKLTQSAMIE
ncbi:MAG: sensor histidine kinase [Sedimenticola thiotaurini]|uniref:C4-dicarboxylate transport sensor protein DctB n=1 Tax=Sedimenticola thiotaurini TaxID=1543721 RepID=A0A558DFB6_9GAMM|nr:MAG: sensor histidine kinase [Sedimenticola thiotaurini]